MAAKRDAVHRADLPDEAEVGEDGEADAIGEGNCTHGSHGDGPPPVARGDKANFN